jgi:hypothetical protein
VKVRDLNVIHKFVICHIPCAINVVSAVALLRTDSQCRVAVGRVSLPKPICVACAAGITVIGIKAGLLYDTFQPVFAKCAAATVDPDLINIQNIQEVIEA